MKFTYTVESVDPASKLVRVIYTPEDTSLFPHHIKVALPVDESTDALHTAIVASAPVAKWEADIDARTTVNPTAYTELSESAHVVEEAEYDKASAPLAPEPEAVPTEKEVAEEKVARIARSRYEAESKGLVWTDAKGGSWFLDTSVASQNRFASARLAVQSSTRVDGGVWKCASLDAFGAATLVYRPTSNEEIIVWSDLVHAHVQKCFEAEAKSVEKAVQGSKDSDVFMREFDAL
tara:strand:+ start:1423 stop:2127 length:705 start_codon:yes stop_codon:yes gene_type:complete